MKQTGRLSEVLLAPLRYDPQRAWQSWAEAGYLNGSCTTR